MQPRFDLYANVHKALRKAMSDVLFELGRLDLSSETAVETTVTLVRELLDGLSLHLAVESQFVHAALLARGPYGIAHELERDHDEHKRAISLLREDLSVFSASFHEPATVRAGRARHLYLALSRFIAENFLHMAVEEMEMNARLWETFTDQELMNINQDIIAHETPEQIARSLKYMLPAMPPLDRAQLLGDARSFMPEEAFHGVLALARFVLSSAEYEQLSQQLSELSAA